MDDYLFQALKPLLVAGQWGPDLRLLFLKCHNTHFCGEAQLMKPNTGLLCEVQLEF